MKLSKEGTKYLNRYKDLYAGKEYYSDGVIVKDSQRLQMFDGFAMYKHLIKYIDEEVKDRDTFTFLDYGCGQAKHLYARVMKSPDKGYVNWFEYFKGKCQFYYPYDPANPKYIKKPPHALKFDIIVCADVMEHVHEDDVDEVIADIAKYAHKDSKIMFAICGAPAVKSFIEDKVNLHITQKPREWWKEKIKAHCDITKVILVWHGGIPVHPKRNV